MTNEEKQKLKMQRNKERIAYNKKHMKEILNKETEKTGIYYIELSARSEKFNTRIGKRE